MGKPAANQNTTKPSGRIDPKIWVLLGILVFTLISYWNVIQADFVNYDDPLYVTNNPIIRHGLDPEAVKTSFSECYANFWHPLTLISHMLDVEMYGFKPWGHHLTNLILHLLNTSLFFLLMTLFSRKIWACAVIAAIFALHPTHVESVAWVAERKDLLSSFFGLISLVLYVIYTRKPRISIYALVFFAAGFSLMAKSTLVTLPCIFLLMDYWPLERLNFARKDAPVESNRLKSIGFLALEKIPFFALSILFSVLSYAAQAQGRAISSLDTLPLSLRCANAVWSYTIYLYKTFLPVKLAFFYPYPDKVAVWKILLGLAILSGITGLCIRYARKAPYLPVGWFWFLGTLVPVIGLVPVGLHGMADRYLYVSHMGLFWAVGFGLQALFESHPSETARKSYMAVAVFLCLILAIMTRAQVMTWKNSSTLFAHAIEVTDDNFMAHHLLAHELTTKGEYREALGHLKKSISYNPQYPDAYNNIAVNLFHLGQTNQALQAFSKALKIDPVHFETLNNMGLALFFLKRYNDSLRSFQKALEIDPSNPNLLLMVGKNMLMLGSAEKAVPYLKQVLRITPGNAEAKKYLADIKNIEK